MGIRATIIVVLTTIIASTSVFSEPVGESLGEIWVDGPLDERVGATPLSPDSTADHRGRHIYVWDDMPSGDGTGIDVFLRIFNASGGSLIGPVKVNSLVADNQRYARVAVSSNGAFLVIWESFEPVDGLPGVFYPAIRSQLFDSDGIPDGSEQLLSAISTELQTPAFANVAALAGGGYVAVWQSYATVDVTDTSVGYKIQGRIIRSDGIPDGGQFQVNALKTGVYEQYASVTGLADGGFLAVWANPEIQARRFMANGTPLTSDFQVNTYSGLTTHDQTSVAATDDGRVLVVWRVDETGPSEEIRGRMYSSAMNALGTDFRINTFTSGAQSVPQVAGYGKAGFFVVWQSFGSSGTDAAPTSIEGRVVTGPDTFSGTQFLVNQYTNNSQETPAIGGLGGYLAVAWMSRENEEVMGQVIMGQLWNICGIFCDGFESQ